MSHKSNFIRITFLFPLVGLFLCASFLVHAQSSIKTLPHFTTTLAAHHNDDFPIYGPVGVPITEMSLFLDIGGMNQINPNGASTVFRTDSLSPVMSRDDSHFLLDPSQFAIITQEENQNIMRATVRFHNPVIIEPTFHSIVQVVARDGHSASDGSFGSLTGTVTTVNGDILRIESYSIIPEPSSWLLYLTGLVVVLPVFKLRKHS